MKLRFLAVLSLFAVMATIALSASCSRRGGVSKNALRYGLTTEPVTLDPLSPANTADGRSILFNVFEGLVKPDSSGNLVPALAESYKTEQNGLVYVFTLRQGVLFHNGEAIKTSDVVFSLETAVKAGYSGFDRIAGIETRGEREIRLTLKESDPEFLPYLTVGVIPENNPDREKNPVGTGPFKVENYLPQQYLTLVKNPHYWQEGLPFLDKVTVVFVNDNDALLTGLKGGNIDAASVTGALLPQLEAGGGEFDIFPWNSNTVQLLALNNAEKPFDNVLVRRAVNFALDIPGIIDTAFYGKGEASGSPLIPGLKNTYDESLKDPYPRDIAWARALLAEAGYPDGFPLEITVPSNYTMHVDTAQVIVNQLKDAGINATIRLVDWGAWLSEVYRGRKYQATVISLDANNVSPRSFLERYCAEAGGNFINFRNISYDEAFNAALSENDAERRISLYKDCQRIISENAASVYIQDITGFRAFRGGLYGGVVNYPLYIIDFASMYRK